MKSLITDKIRSLQARLKKDPRDFLAWLDLGIYQKMATDYEGAVISWQYASRLDPTSYIPLGNLGDLYAYFLKDKTKALEYYKKAISNGSTQSYLYVQLALVYKDVFKDMDKALAIIDQGLSKLPNNPSLLETKANLERQ